MPLTSALQVFLVGTAGGILLEVYHWYVLSREGRLPEFSNKPIYWIMSAVMALLGGGLAWLYFGSRTDAILALHVGLSAPLILQKLTSVAAQPPGAKSVRSGGWLSFIRW